MCELCRESRRAEPLESFSLCVPDALGCFPRAAPPGLGAWPAGEACAVSFLALAVELQPAQAQFVSKLGVGRTCRFPVMCFVSCG